MAPPIYIHGQLDEAEELVLGALQFLPNECIIYAQPKLVYKYEVRYPDFVIVYHEWGVVVLEVKDWIEVVDRNGKEARIRQRNGRLKWRGSPIEQARGAAQVLENMLKEDDDLRNYAGKLDFYYAYGGVLPHLTSHTIAWLEKVWGKNYLLGRDDLHPERITEKIAIVNGFSLQRCMMTEYQVRAVCAIIDERNKNVDRATDEFKGVYDRIQESLYKESIIVQPSATEPEQPVQESLELVPPVEARIKHLEAEMPEEALTLRSTPHVRLVRGFAGTGKTDVLILRAHYLHEQYPDLDILVTTFNDPLYENRLLPELKDLRPQVDVIKFDTLCTGIYRKRHGRWIKPQDTGGLLVARMTEDYPLVEELGQSFIADEFIWMKETGRTERQRYVTGAREGRGGVSGRTFSRKMKEQIFDLFEVYQRLLRDMPAYDWVDLHEKTLRYFQEGIRPDKQYDVILVDEAQHFAPTWMRIVTEFLKPGGNLFLCDDPSQSVYRYYSWRQKGVEVRGRTRWLRIPYRNTRQIFEAAYALITDNQIAQRLLAEGGEQVQPDLDSTTMREGPRPQVHSFSSWEAEREFVVREIETLIRQKGMLPNEIGILHEKRHVLDRYKPLVPKGVQLYEVKRQTGLEYKAVFIPQIQQILDRTVGISWEEDEERQRLKFYMAMARARKWLYLLHGRKWPKVLDPIRPYVEWIEH